MTTDDRRTDRTEVERSTRADCVPVVADHGGRRASETTRDSPYHASVGESPVIDDEVALPGPGKPNRIEVTQSIQHYRAVEHLTDPLDRGPDNSIRLVRYKPAWVRVYVRNHPNAGEGIDVTGTLTIERRVGTSWSPVETIPPVNGPVPALPSPVYADQRGDSAATLNFVIPQAMMWGTLRLRADVSAVDSCVEYERTYTTIVRATLQQSLRIAGVLIDYQHIDGEGNITSFPAPSMSDLMETMTEAYTMFPVNSPLSPANFRYAGTFHWGQPIASWKEDWVTLRDKVIAAKIADGNLPEYVYYGLLPAGTPIPHSWKGIAHTGVGISRNGSRSLAAHEVGHLLGLDHVAGCGSPKGPDPNYPSYEPYDAGASSGNIGVYGLDVNDGTVHEPTTKDIMTYCSNRWISKYHYSRLLYNEKLDPEMILNASLPFADGAEDSFDPYVVLTGSFDADGTPEVGTVARISTRGYVGDGLPTGFVAELLDSETETLGAAPVYSFEAGPMAEPGDPGDRSAGNETRSFVALVPDRGPGTTLRIRRGREVYWRRDAPDERPSVSNVEARLADGEEDVVEISWDVETRSEVDPETWIRWSDDDGAWHSLGVGIDAEDGTASLDISNVMARDTLRFEVLVHDGFYTASAVSKEVTMPRRPPLTAIMHPPAGVVLDPNAPLRLWAFAAEASGRDIADASCRWLLNDEEVATGKDVWVGNPGPGRHTITLVVDGGYDTKRDTVALEVTPDDSITELHS